MNTLEKELVRRLNDTEYLPITNEDSAEIMVWQTTLTDESVLSITLTLFHDTSYYIIIKLDNKYIWIPEKHIKRAVMRLYKRSSNLIYKKQREENKRIAAEVLAKLKS